MDKATRLLLSMMFKIWNRQGGEKDKTPNLKPG